MALSSTLYVFEVELSDIDRSVYEALDLRVPCHPSEDAGRLILRLLARLLFAEPGLEFGRGLSHVEEPALWTRGGGNEIHRWIDVGTPSAERLHRASKRARATHVVTTKSRVALLKEWAKAKIHGQADIEIVELPANFVSTLAATLDRRNHWFVTIQDAELHVSSGNEAFDTPIARRTLEEFLRVD